MKQLLTLMILVSASYIAIAQNNGSGKIEIIKDARVDQLMELYHAEDLRSPGVPGYRIQVFSSSNRSETQKMKDDIYAQFPTMRPVMQYQAPNYKLRIGAYRSRMDAFKDLLELQPVYTNAFIVKDELGLGEL
jgi:hypothetical protein